jgi:hypothetical protein
MLRARESSKKQKLLNKTALSALNLKKPDPSLESRPTNVTYRPKYVQKQWREEQQPSSSNKKSFFNKTQNTQGLNRSFERNDQRVVEMKSRTPSPMREKFSHGLLTEERENTQLIDRLFEGNRKKHKEQIVENLILNILGKDEQEETP